MIIAFRHLVPIPLKDRFLQRSSDIWNTDTRFEPGEYIKIKAPSGTGKTTLIHTVYSLRGDYEGAILFDDMPIRELHDDKLATIRQQKISIVFQDLRLFPNLTARENIELKRVLQEPYHAPEMIDTMAAQLGVTHILEQKAGLCSYGEQQRIAIIRALIQPFSWLIMDEPFSHLDNANISKAVALIHQECVQRKAGLVITDLEHDSHFAYTKELNL
jgi:putative ABC transport system ATP-binding protein